MTPNSSCRIAASLLALSLVSSAGPFMGPDVSHASAPNPNMNVTLTIYSGPGSLEDFVGANPKNAQSIYNLFHTVWHAKWPSLQLKEVDIPPSQMLTKLTLAVNSSNPPDIVILNTVSAGFPVVRKQVTPLDSYFEQYGIKQSYFLPGMAKVANFGGHWWAIPLVSNPIAGQRVVIPKYISPFGYTAKNLVTLDDWYNLSKKMVQFDHSGHLTRIGFPAYNNQAPYGGIQLSESYCLPGHGLYNAADQPTPSDPCVVAAVAWQKKLMDLYGGSTKYNAFIAGDPDIWTGSAKAYVPAGKAATSGADDAYWAVSGFDVSNFGVKGGLAYDMTALPPVPDASKAAAYVANMSDTAQIAIIPRGAKHPDAAFAFLKLVAWDNGYRLGPTTNGTSVAADQEKWVQALIAGEASNRKANGLAGNPVADLAGIKQQPALVRTTTGHFSNNPVDSYYQTQFALEENDVFYGRKTPAAAMQELQKKVNAEESRLKSQYGSWNW